MKAVYGTLYRNLGIENNKGKQQAESFKIPIKIALGYDGYYVDYFRENKTEIWTGKKSYSIVDKNNNIKINFTLNDIVYVTDLSDGVVTEGKQQSFASKYPNACFGDEKKFNEVKHRVISDILKQELQCSTYYDNYYAKLNGWKLDFNLVGGSRAFDSISFIAFVQDEPHKVIKAYNSYGFGTAKLHRAIRFYGYELSDGRKVYQKASYPIGAKNLTIFNSARDASMRGYKPLK